MYIVRGILCIDCKNAEMNNNGVQFCADFVQIAKNAILYNTIHIDTVLPCFITMLCT